MTPKAWSRRSATIADALTADQPLGYVNAAVVAFTGHPAFEIPRNCRFLRGRFVCPVSSRRPAGWLLPAIELVVRAVLIVAKPRRIDRARRCCAVRARRDRHLIGTWVIG